MLDQKFKERLEGLQFSDQQRLILIDQVPVGYGGQMSARLVGLKMGLALDRKVIFPSDADVPYVQSVVRPFSWSGDLQTAQWSPMGEIFGSDPREIIRFEYFDYQRRLRQHGMSIDEWVEGILADKFQLSREELQKLDGWLISWLRFVPDFEERLSRDIERLGISNKVLGVHVRRGDKKVETPYVTSERINDAIQRIHSVWKYEGVFVATDSPDALSDVKLPPGVVLLFDREEVRHNNANHKMLFANPEMSPLETYTAFKNFRLLCACGGIVGQDNAHFATLAASYILNRDSAAERIHLIDPRAASRATLFVHRLKWGFRSIVKKVFPREILSRVDRISHRRR